MKKKEEKSKRWLVVILLIGMLVPMLFSLYVGVSSVMAADKYKYIKVFQPNVGGDEGVTADVIRKYMEDTNRTKSPLYGKEEAIIQKADENGINRAFLVGLMTVETNMGLAGVGKTANNFGGIRRGNYATVEEGLDAVAGLMNRYVNGEIGTLEPNSTYQEILDVYSPSYENDHSNIFDIQLSVFKRLGVSAEGMQSTGKLKDGTAAKGVDYTPSSEGTDLKSLNNLAEYCPINCDLVSEQEVTEHSDGADVGMLKILDKGELWQNDDLLTTDLGFTSDKTTEENLKLFLTDAVGVSNGEELAEYFYKAGYSSGLDPRFLVSHWAVETDKGTSESWTSSYNAFGWSTGSDFNSEREGIIEGAKLIAVNYYNEGQKTINSMIADEQEHIVSADEDWGKSIASIMSKSEEFIGESDGKLNKDVKIKSGHEAIYEQCFGAGTRKVSAKSYSGDYIDQVIARLRDENFTDEAIAGVLGNMQKESHIKPYMLQGYTSRDEEVKNMTDEERDTALKNHTNGAYAAGIVQWEKRFDQVRALAADMGVSPYTLEPQMEIVVKELKTTTAGSYYDGKLYDMFQETTSIANATSAFAQHFERCRACKPGTGEFEERTEMSKELYNQHVR